MNATEKLELQIAENADGSANVVIPPELAEEEPQQLAEGGEVSRKNEDNSDEEPITGDHTDAEREEIRAARREERRLKKQLHREKTRESSSLITSLRKQNEALAERLAKVEHRTSGAELARLDKTIDDTAVQVEYAKMKIREAMQQQDGEAMVQAQELLADSKNRLENLASIKKQAVSQMSQPQKQNIQVPDQSVQRLAAQWMKSNSWYDPQATDFDSEVAQTVDKRLTKEGFDPSTEEYWEELDTRLEKLMPHNYKKERKEAKNKPPKSIVGGSGRETGATVRNGDFVLDPERVKAIKEAGMWDDAEKRKKMISTYIKFDRAAKQQRN